MMWRTAAAVSRTQCTVTMAVCPGISLRWQAAHRRSALQVACCGRVVPTAAEGGLQPHAAKCLDLQHRISLTCAGIFKPNCTREHPASQFLLLRPTPLPRFWRLPPELANCELPAPRKPPVPALGGVCCARSCADLMTARGSCAGPGGCSSLA